MQRPLRAPVNFYWQRYGDEVGRWQLIKGSQIFQAAHGAGRDNAVPRKISQSTESGTLGLTDKLAKIELKVKKLLSILEQE